MEFDYKLFEDSYNEIKKMNFFNIIENEIKNDDYEVIDDFEKAFQNAFTRLYDYENMHNQTWVDILEENIAVVRQEIYKNENYAELNREIRNLEMPIIEFNIDDEDVQEEIQNEIELCLKSRLVCGKSNIFFEKLYEAYRLGGWPCGWNNGKIIVYFRTL